MQVFFLERSTKKLGSIRYPPFQLPCILVKNRYILGYSHHTPCWLGLDLPEREEEVYNASPQPNGTSYNPRAHHGCVLLEQCLDPAHFRNRPWFFRLRKFWYFFSINHSPHIKRFRLVPRGIFQAFIQWYRSGTSRASSSKTSIIHDFSFSYSLL